MSIDREILNLNKPARQRGLTLIEIMVALLIGSFLLAGVLQIFIVNKQTYRVQENLSRMQENGRFALDYLNRYIRLAGYIANEPFLDISNRNQNKRNTLVSDVFNPTANTAITANGSDRAIIGFNSAGLNNSDNITVRFQGNPPYNLMTDCLGNPIASANGDVIATNQFYIPTDQGNNLYCRTIHNNANGTVVANTSQTQPVIDGVENMQIRYCTRTSIPDNFSCVATNPNWNEVESIRISLLMRSADNNLVNAPQPYQFDTNGDGVDETITPTDRRLRRVFTTTITLRNLVASD